MLKNFIKILPLPRFETLGLFTVVFPFIILSNKETVLCFISTLFWWYFQGVSSQHLEDS